MRIEESIVIDRSPQEVFDYLKVRSNDGTWMASVEESEWLEPGTKPGVGARGRMVMKNLGRRVEYIDEVTKYEPGRVIAHRTVEGPIALETACLTESEGDRCRATVVAEADRFASGPLGAVINPFLARGLRRAFRADLARLKEILEG